MPNPDGFERFKDLLKELGSPERDFRVFHIAGTNGKGSVSVMIASILEKAGYSVGLYTSPHLETECERMQIWDGSHRMIEQEQLNELKIRVAESAERIAGKDGRITLFELYTAAAYLFFAENAPDYVVLECGLGGRLDMTNTIEKPLVSVITEVSLDHTAELGSTIEMIAGEKAGIIKQGVPVVSEATDPAARDVIIRTAAEKGSTFTDASPAAEKYAGYELGMRGAHQIRNAAAAAEAIRVSGVCVPEDAVRSGLAEAVIPGRFEVIGESPYMIIDGAHNPGAIEALTHNFTVFAEEHKIKRSMVIFGCMKDKDYPHMIQLLTGNMKGCSFGTAAADYGRAESAAKLAERFAACGCACKCYDSVSEAIADAEASGYECILITGSIYLAGDARQNIMEAIS